MPGRDDVLTENEGITLVICIRNHAAVDGVYNYKSQRRGWLVKRIHKPNHRKIGGFYGRLEEQPME